MPRFAAAPFASGATPLPPAAWPLPDVPSLAEILRRYSERGSVLGRMDLPESRRASSDAEGQSEPGSPDEGPEFSEVLQGLQVREVATDVWLGELVRTAGG